MKIFKKFSVFFLCFVLFFCTLSISPRKEVDTYAVVVVDDAVIVGLIITGSALILGTYSYQSSKGTGAVDAFKDAFGTDTYKHLYAFITASDKADAAFSLAELTTDNPKLAEAAKKVKSQYKYPVQMVSDNCYRTYDTDGSIIEFNSLIEASTHIMSSGMLYYMVDSLDDCPFQVNTSGKAVLKEGVYNDLKSAVSTLTKTVVNVGKNVLDWTFDKYKGLAGLAMANDETAFSALQASTCSTYLSKYKDKSAIFFYDGYNTFGKIDVCSAFAFTGVLLELRLADGSRLYGSMSVDKFNSLNDSYSSSGNISVISNNLSSKLLLCAWNRTFADGISDQTYEAYNNWIDPSVYIFNNGGVTSFQYVTRPIGNDWGLYTKVTPLEGGSATMINSGDTGNYVIGQVESDGTISYSLYGQSSSSNYIDGLDTGDVSVKVSGDVEVSEQILQTVIDNSATVEDVNSSVADINESVKVIDNTVNNGFDSVKAFLSNIQDVVSNIGSSLSSFFSTLWGWLSSILSAIKNVADPIVHAIDAGVDVLLPDAVIDVLDGIGDDITNLPSTISSAIDAGVDVILPVSVISTLSDVKDGILAIPGSIADIVTDVGDIAVSFPGDVADTISNIWDSVLDLPGNILSGLKELLISLFVPSDIFFNNWNNKFKNMLITKLPYDTYNSFFNDIKAISRTKLNDVTVNLFGKECTVLTFSWYYDNEETINHWIRGVMFIVLIFFNLNQMYKLIRGTSLYKIDKYLDQ